MNIPESIIAARNVYIDEAQERIIDAYMGVGIINDLPSYIAWQEQTIDNFKSGMYDHTYDVRQRAHYIRTGECVPLLG